MRIAVFTFDGYAWTIAPFLKYFQRAWPECPYPVEIVTTEKRLPYSNVTYLGKDEGFSSNLIKYVEGKTEPFLMFLGDFILCDPDLNILNAAIREIERPDVAMVRVHPSPGPTLPWSDLIGEIDTSLPYATCLASTIWKPWFIRDIARHGETAGQFEGAGKRIPKDYKFHLLCTKNSAIGARNLMGRGLLAQETVEWMKNNP